MQHRQTDWRTLQSVLHTLLIATFVLSLFYYWFAIANRYIIFLYAHLGATPFDERTRSRYWMAGLVAAGAVMVLDVLLQWLLGRLAGLRYRRYRPPPWQQIWLCAALPIATGILALTMQVNAPTLPLALAVACVVATLSGLAVALAASAMAAHQMAELGWRLACGVGMAPSLLLLRAVELPQRGLLNARTAAWLAVGGLAASIVSLVIIGSIRIWRKRQPLSTLALFASGLGVCYLLLPLLHHLVFVPAHYRYISASTNFFAFDLRLQMVIFAIAGVIAGGIAQFQQMLQCHGQRQPQEYL